jgi:hypothetical protein
MWAIIFAILVAPLFSEQAKEKMVTLTCSNERRETVLRSLARLRNRDGTDSI